MKFNKTLQRIRRVYMESLRKKFFIATQTSFAKFWKVRQMMKAKLMVALVKIKNKGEVS